MTDPQAISEGTLRLFGVDVRCYVLVPEPRRHPTGRDLAPREASRVTAVQRCVPCRGTGIYPLDIAAVESGRLRPENARVCGACYGPIRPEAAVVVRAVLPAPEPPPAGDLLALAVQRNGGRNPFL